MSVQIIINGETATEAIKELSTLASSMGGSAPVTAVAEKAAPKSHVKPASETTTTVITPAEKEEVEEVADSGLDENEAETEQADEVEVITDVQLREAGGPAGKRNRAGVIALLAEFGASNLTAVAQEKRAEFVERLNAL